MLKFFGRQKPKPQDQAEQVEQPLEHEVAPKSVEVIDPSATIMANTPVETEQQETESTKQGFVGRLKSGLSKSAGRLSGGIGDIFTKRKLDQEALDELEELLITSDMGVATSQAIVESISKDRFNKDITPEEIKLALAREVETILTPVAQTLEIDAAKSPYVILVTGVNGNGKTTTIGKLAHYWQGQGHKVMLAACDTFRAAAVAQLEVWAERVGCELVTGKDQADPASVAYQALERAKAEQVDILLLDTAGRLHNKANLMEQLSKLVRVVKKLDDTAPHNTLLVLDATTGQNAHHQVKEFKQTVDIDGLIVTKLDGTAKGGVVVALAKAFPISLYAIGVGEGIDDLRPFDAEDFAKGLVGE